MKVVAVIVTFNRKRLLLENVQRLLSQTINIHKIIIVDNCSTDGTKEYLNKNGILDNKNIYYHSNINEKPNHKRRDYKDEYL